MPGSKTSSNTVRAHVAHSAPMPYVTGPRTTAIKAADNSERNFVVRDEAQDRTVQEAATKFISLDDKGVKTDITYLGVPEDILPRVANDLKALGASHAVSARLLNALAACAVQSGLSYADDAGAAPLFVAIKVISQNDRPQDMIPCKRCHYMVFDGAQRAQKDAGNMGNLRPTIYGTQSTGSAIPGLDEVFEQIRGKALLIYFGDPEHAAIGAPDVSSSQKTKTASLAPDLLRLEYAAPDQGLQPVLEVIATQAEAGQIHPATQQLVETMAEYAHLKHEAATPEAVPPGSPEAQSLAELPAQIAEAFDALPPAEQSLLQPVIDAVAPEGIETGQSPALAASSATPSADFVPPQTVNAAAVPPTGLSAPTAVQATPATTTTPAPTKTPAATTSKGQNQSTGTSKPAKPQAAKPQPAKPVFQKAATVRPGVQEKQPSQPPKKVQKTHNNVRSTPKSQNARPPVPPPANQDGGARKARFALPSSSPSPAPAPSPSPGQKQQPAQIMPAPANEAVTASAPVQDLMLVQTTQTPTPPPAVIPFAAEIAHAPAPAPAAAATAAPPQIKSSYAPMRPATIPTTIPAAANDAGAQQPAPTKTGKDLADPAKNQDGAPKRDALYNPPVIEPPPETPEQAAHQTPCLICKFGGNCKDCPLMKAANAINEEAEKAKSEKRGLIGRALGFGT